MVKTALRTLKTVVFFSFTILSMNAPANPTQITDFFAPHNLGNIALFHDENGFRVCQDGTEHAVKKCWMDPLLRSITPDKLEKFFANDCYIAVNKMSDNEFTLHAKSRLRGGGPVAGRVAYWVTKLFYYGTAAALGGSLTRRAGIPGTALLVSTGLYVGTEQFTTGIQFAAKHLVEAANGVEASAKTAELIFNAITYLP